MLGPQRKPVSTAQPQWLTNAIKLGLDGLRQRMSEAVAVLRSEREAVKPDESP